jgi:putative tricarboxylic transport membrane protein
MRSGVFGYGALAALCSIASLVIDSATAQTTFDAGGPIEVVVHSGPGGGSDVHARQVSELLVKEGLIDQAWPVINKTGGSGAAAMAYMAEQAGKANVIAAMAITWITTPLTNAEAQVKTQDLTPIALLVTEPTIMAVRADSPWNSLKDFVDAAAAAPGTLTQSGGSATSADALAAEVIKAKTGTKWGYLSFEGGGERLAALLGENASMMFGGPSDFGEHVKAGELKVIATIGSERTSLFPDAPTLAESGYDFDVPQNLRGIMGPPNMPPEAVAYYEDIFRKLLETEGWKSYAAENAFTTRLLGSAEFRDYLAGQIDTLSVVLDDLGLLAK